MKAYRFSRTSLLFGVGVAIPLLALFAVVYWALTDGPWG